MATIIFDFDDTLFDTKKLKETIFSQLASHGASKAIIEESYKECRADYCLLKHTQVLKKYDLDIPDSIHNWISLFDFEPYLFPEVINDLKKLSEDNYLVLLTKGDENFQKSKIKSSNISKYFKEIHITQKDKEEFLKDKKYPHPIHFINDKESENEIIKKLFPKIIIKKRKSR